MRFSSLQIAGASDVGRNRKENQDHFLIAKLRRHLQVVATDVNAGECDELFGVDDGFLLVVADGMGGHSDGALTSDRAVKACSRYVLDMMQWFLRLSPENEDDFIDELKQSIEVAQRSIWGRNQPDGSDSGTTVTMAYILCNRVYLVHVGDSRCYLLRDSELRQLTTDHTVAQQLLDAGALSADEAQSSRWRNVLWNCVGGIRKEVSVEVCRIDLHSEDQLLLCSDGLTEMLPDEQIKELLGSSDSCEIVVERLISAANEAGGHDNITTVVAKGFSGTGESSRECLEVTFDGDDSLDDTVGLETC